MSISNAYDRTKFLDELNDVLFLGDGLADPITPEEQKLQARTNLGLESAALTTAAGAGITNNTGGGSYSSSVSQIGDTIITQIFVDVDGLDSSTTDLDVIGFDEATDQPAYLGQITTAQNGLIFAGDMTCVETVAGGVTTVDLYASPEADNVFDALITDDTGEHALVTGSAAWTAGRTQPMTTLPLPDEYLYLTGGAAGTAAEYTAGQFIITLYGRAV